MATIVVKTILRDAAVQVMAETGASVASQAMEFAAQRIHRGLVAPNGVFWRACYGLGRKAGRAFPYIYRDHLYAYMASQPVNIAQVGLGAISIDFFLDLGSKEDYEKGFHHNALIDTGISKDLRSKSGGFLTKRSGLQQVRFPPGFSGEDLLNSKARRTEWWQQAIIGRNPITNVKAGPIRYRVPDLPTYDEVAEARLYQAWMLTGKAPQWHILEYGAHQGTEPYTPPLHFTEYVRVASICYGQRVFNAAAETIVSISERQGRVAIANGGRSLRGGQGRFVGFLSELEGNIGNVEPCFGGIL